MTSSAGSGSRFKGSTLLVVWTLNKLLKWVPVSLSIEWAYRHLLHKTDVRSEEEEEEVSNTQGHSTKLSVTKLGPNNRQSQPVC